MRQQNIWEVLQNLEFVKNPAQTHNPIIQSQNILFIVTPNPQKLHALFHQRF